MGCSDEDVVPVEVALKVAGGTKSEREPRDDHYNDFQGYLLDDWSDQEHSRDRRDESSAEEERVSVTNA